MRRITSGGSAIEGVVVARHECAIRHEPVERITHKCELEITGERLLAQERTHLLQADVAVLDLRQFLERETAC